MNDKKPNWLDGNLANAFEPSVDDLRNLKREVSKLRKAFDPVYKDIRNKVIAHTEFKDPNQISLLFSKTQIGEIEKTFYGLYDILESIWELLQNGRRPQLASKDYDYRNRISEATQSVLKAFNRNQKRLA